MSETWKVRRIRIGITSEPIGNIWKQQLQEHRISWCVCVCVFVSVCVGVFVCVSVCLCLSLCLCVRSVQACANERVYRRHRRSAFVPKPRMSSMCATLADV